MKNISPFYTEPIREKNPGVFSNYGMPYRFGFRYCKGDRLPEGGGTAGTFYYGITLGCENSDHPITSTTCWIATSLFTDGIVSIYKYKSGVLAIFSGTSIVGYINDGGETLWGQPATAQYVFNSAPLSGARATFLADGNIEERALIYEFKLDTTSNSIDYVEKKENPGYPFFTAFAEEYCIIKNGNSLYIGLPEKFVITDQRPDLETVDYEEGETDGLSWKSENEFSGDDANARIEITVTGTAGVAPTPPTPPDPPPDEDPTEDALGDGNYISLETLDGEPISGRTFFAKSIVPDHYATDLIGAMTEGDAFVLYAKITLGESASPGTLNRDFSVVIAHVVDDEPVLPTASSGEIIVRLCTVCMKQNIFSITKDHDYGWRVGGGKIVFRRPEAIVPGDVLPDGTEDNIALRWDNSETQWEAAPPLDSSNSDLGAFASGGKVIVGAVKGSTGLIQLQERTLTLPDATEITANSITFQGGKIEYDGSAHKLYQYDVKISIAADGTLSFTSYDSTNYTTDGGGHRHEITTSVSHATQHVTT